MSIYQKGGDRSIQIGKNNYGNIYINDHPGEYIPPDVRDRLWREEVIKIIKEGLQRLGKTVAWLRSVATLYEDIRFDSFNDLLNNKDRNYDLYRLYEFITSIETRRTQRDTLIDQILTLSKEKNIGLVNDLQKMTDSELKVTHRWLDRREPINL